VNGKIGGGIGSLYRGRPVAEEAAHIHDGARAAALPIMPNGREEAVENASPERLEHAAPVGHGHVPDLPEDGDAGIVDSGVEMTELPDCGLGKVADIILPPDAADDMDSLPFFLISSTGSWSPSSLRAATTTLAPCRAARCG
jgi:hypothetical protein